MNVDIHIESKVYGNNYILKDIHLSIPPGAIYGIVGKNGAGKTTLFKCICGMESFDGQITSAFDSFKNHIGYLETNPTMLSRITGWEYLKLLCMARGIHKEDFYNQNIFDLPLDQYAENYSTGMKKKLALMGILFQKNNIFLLDEPFNGVDIQSNMIILELLQKLKSTNKSILISSHIFSTLYQICDQIFLIDEGQIKENYSPEKYKILENNLRNEMVVDLLNNFHID